MLVLSAGATAGAVIAQLPARARMSFLPWVIGAAVVWLLAATLRWTVLRDHHPPRSVRLGLWALAPIVAGALFLWAQAERREAFRIGVEAGETRATKALPPQPVEKGRPWERLAGSDAVQGLPIADAAEAAALAGVLDRAPAPCSELARRGYSFATALAEPDPRCVVSKAQARLALAALRGLGADEAAAALRVERREDIDVDGRSVRGGSDAVLVVWGDFECPYCQRAAKFLRQLNEAEPGLGIVWKHYPLNFHPAAIPAGMAAEAAGEQGRFWDMADALLKLGPAMGDSVDSAWTRESDGPVPFEALAREIGLDVERFRTDMRGPAVAARVEGDRAEGGRIGVRGTPTYHLDGRLMEGARTTEAFSVALARARAEREFRFSWDAPDMGTFELPPPAGSDPPAPASSPAPAAQPGSVQTGS